MKKKLIGIIAIVVIAAVARFNVYAPLNAEVKLSDLVLADVEAQANNYEIGGWGTNWKDYMTSCTITETVKVGWNFMLQIEITETRTYTAEKSVCGYGSGWCLASAGC